MFFQLKFYIRNTFYIFYHPFANEHFPKYVVTDAGIRNARCREHKTFSCNKTRQREQSLQIALKPVWRIPLC